eukprot:CAMPEP_0206043190 /NCGR_PEP_ID=MMETSP1466-20131121/8053_1 /ASSEMBLY_ACC=CAM_ASM_001126 /TAXON_ID=44452 /ORGANISM="Pavlova gyrans, Strain CCMP608" /LENGTH=83 /DNA_ID=CAMNT_0053417965 /DNA_START=43 /DNA_END=292 /DNA_ORIENTATION=+
MRRLLASPMLSFGGGAKKKDLLLPAPHISDELSDSALAAWDYLASDGRAVKVIQTPREPDTDGELAFMIRAGKLDFVLAEDVD